MERTPTLEELITLHQLIERLEMTDDQRARWRSLQSEAADGLLDAFAATTHVLALSIGAARLSVPPPNVPVEEKDPKKRITAAWKVISHTVDTLDTASEEDARFNAKVYLLRLGWHESRDFQARKQSGTGPGRGLFQTERAAAVDSLTYAQKFRPANFTVLATYAGTNVAGLTTALEALAKATGRTLPAENIITRAVMTDTVAGGDAFAAGLARSYFKRLGSHVFPTDIAETAEDWFKHYNKSPASEHEVKTKKFIADANRLEELRKTMKKVDGGLM